MSITDGLRKWNEETVSTGACERYTALRDIADRIEAAHEKELLQVGDNVHDMMAALMKSDYIKLPKDKSGKPIRIGDNLHRSGVDIEVQSLRITSSGNWVAIPKGADKTEHSLLHTWAHLEDVDTQEKINRKAQEIGSGLEFHSDLTGAIFDLLRRQRELDGVKNG